jgi:branched-chain amino acid transport system substrate-binding protein
VARRSSSRRSLAAVALVVALSAACGGPGSTADGAPNGTGADNGGADDAADTAAADTTVTIGFLGELSGPFAIWGVSARDGMRLAVEELNAGTAPEAPEGLEGITFELLERDTQGTPEEAVTAFRGLVERQGAVAVGGIVSSDVALATARQAEAAEVPLFLVMAGAEGVLDDDSRYTFRTCLPAAGMNVQPLAQYIEAEGITRVGAIVADYSWGRAIEAAIAEQIAPLAGVTVQVEVAPVPETDFTGYLRRFADLDPELLLATGHPPGAPTIARQSAELGFDALVTGSNSPASAVVESVGDAAFDRYLDLSCSDVGGDAWTDLAQRYHERFGRYLEDDAVVGYGQVLLVAEAIAATGTTDPPELAAFLRDGTFELPGFGWPLGWTGWGELRDARPRLTLLRQQSPPDGVNPGAGWFPEVVFEAEPLEPSAPAS